MSRPNGKLTCKHMMRDGDGETLWCMRHEIWIEPNGLECHRCQHGMPVTTQAFRDAIRASEEPVDE